MGVFMKNTNYNIIGNQAKSGVPTRMYVLLAMYILVFLAAGGFTIYSILSDLGVMYIAISAIFFVVSLVGSIVGIFQIRKCKGVRRVAVMGDEVVAKFSSATPCKYQGKSGYYKISYLYAVDGETKSGITNDYYTESEVNYYKSANSFIVKFCGKYSTIVNDNANNNDYGASEQHLNMLEKPEYCDFCGSHIQKGQKKCMFCGGKLDRSKDLR